MLKKLKLPQNYITATQLFALAVGVMIMGHFLFFFVEGAHFSRIPDRILAPIFLIALGYNAGHRLSHFVMIGAFALMAIEFLVLGSFHGSILLTIVLVRLLIEPLSHFMVQNQVWLWALSICFVVLYPLTASLTEYSTIAIILAFAGWLRKNEQSLDIKTTKSSAYFIFALAAYLISVQFAFNYKTEVIVGIGLGAAFIFYLMYNMKTLLLNSIRQKNPSLISNAIRFIGHKSLEIYLAHMILFYALYYIVKM